MNPFDFIKVLQKLLNEDGTEYPAIWDNIPEEYKRDFESWCGEVKQQTWEGMWHVGWFNYHLEYLRYLVDSFLEEFGALR